MGNIGKTEEPKSDGHFIRLPAIDLDEMFYFYKTTPSLFKVIRKLKKKCRVRLHSTLRIGWRKEKCYYGRLLKIIISGLDWKDKFGTPRWEGGRESISDYRSPCIDIVLFSHIHISLDWFFSKDEDEDEIFEQFIWIYLYNDGDFEKARYTWPWRTFDNKTTTWKDYF